MMRMRRMMVAVKNEKKSDGFDDDVDADGGRGNK